MIHIEPFFDKDTSTLTYVVSDPQTKDALIIDPVLDYEPGSSTCQLKSAEKIKQYCKGLNVHWILETHAHADHLSAAQWLKTAIPGTKVAIGEYISKVQATFKTIFNLGNWLKTDGSQFDHLLKDGETLKAGSLTLKVLHTPGHTPACCSYLIEDAVFTGDCLFLPDQGTGRCDFPSGSSATLYDSVTQRLFTLPDTTRVFVGHDYQPDGREIRWESTISEEKAKNVHLKASTTREAYCEFRNSRDRTLTAPRLLLPSIQVNINAGSFPPSEDNGTCYLKIPIGLEATTKL